MTVVGDEGVGKSSFVQRFHSDVFRSDMPSTIGVEFVSRHVTLDDRIHKLQCWDTTGKERFRTIITSYLRGAHGFFILYSVTDEMSFRNLPYWFNVIEKHSSSKPMIIVGCKADLEDERVVSYEEARDFADKRGALLVEVSSKDSTNIEWTFVTLVAAIEWMSSDTGSRRLQWMTSEQGGQNLWLHDAPTEKRRTCGITS